jgi:hypothetical protein
MENVMRRPVVTQPYISELVSEAAATVTFQLLHASGRPAVLFSFSGRHSFTGEG